MWTAFNGKPAQPVQGREAIPYAQRVATGAVSPRPSGAGQNQNVASQPVYPDANNTHNSYYLGQGTTSSHEHAKVKTPLNFNPSYGKSIVTKYRPGAKIATKALTVAGRGNRIGMQPMQARQNQTRPDAGSYGTMTQRPVGNSTMPYGSPYNKVV